MKNALTIFRRDIGSYFTSPIGYIFMIVFVLISVGLYITSFFAFPVADMRSYFNNLPLLLCVFIPAVTMRVWAEERKENTWEMLLTFPMRSRELVLGKFLACFVFYAATVAATLTIPITLAALGKPDTGAIFSGYLGTLLLGAFFLAIGIFFSGFFKDQIVAFVVTLLACFGIFLIGTEFIASYIDGMFPGLGSLLSRLIGVTEHYNAFARGVVELSDLLYFLGWTALFLMLNVMFIEGRSRPRARSTFAAAIVICGAIGLLFNWLVTGTSLARWDATQDKVYTVSQASRTILSQAKAPVQVKYYVTPKENMPTQMADLEQKVTDKLEEIRLASGGKLQYSTVYLNVANVLAEDKKAKEKDDDTSDDKAIEKRMLDKGVEPFSVRAQKEDEVTNKLVYSSLGVGYMDKKEEIIPQIMPTQQMGGVPVDEIEYRLVSTVYKLTREKPPVIAMVAPKEAVNIDPQYRRMLEQMGQPVPTSEDPYSALEEVLRYEKYDVQRVDLTQDSPLPDKYDALVVVNPRELNDRQRWEINRALVAGKSVVMAVQNYEWDYRPTRNGISISKREEKPKINDLLKNYGLTVADEVLMDINHVPLTIQGGNSIQAMLGGGQTVNLPMHVLVTNSSMDPDTSITSRLSTVFYLWGSPLTVDQDTMKKYKFDCKTLLSSTDSAWTAPGTQTLSQAAFDQPSSGQKYPLVVMVSGQFPDAFKDQARPAWPQEPSQPGQPPRPPKPEDNAAQPVTPAPGKLILAGCSEMFRKNFLQPGSGNLDLFINSVDALTLGDELVKVRSRKPIDRIIDRPSPASRNFWKGFNYTAATLIIGGIGIATTLMRRRSRNAYSIAHGAGGED